MLDSQVEQLVCCCKGCQRSDKSQTPDPVLLIAIPKPPNPWVHVGLDIAGPYHTAPQRQQFVVTLVDYMSGYPDLLLTTGIRSSAVIRWLRELFAQYGCPDELASDNGPQFRSQEFQLFLEQSGVKWIPSTVYI